MSTENTFGVPVKLMSRGNIFGLLASTASNLRNAIVANPSILFGIIVSLYLSQFAYYIFLHPYSKIPGPFLASFSKLWINTRQFRGSWHNDILEVHRQYGPVVRIAPDEVSFVDREALKTLYGHGTGTKKVVEDPRESRGAQVIDCLNSFTEPVVQSMGYTRRTSQVSKLVFRDPVEPLIAAKAFSGRET
jgi:hypothetical protein